MESIACRPPFKRFSIGEGNVTPFPKYLKRGTPVEAAAACALANETARVAFAPTFDLSGVPSSESIVLSISSWFFASRPTIPLEITSFTLDTAFWVPFPAKRRLSPSRSSSASWLPVLAPEGTAAHPLEPSSKIISASTVGSPLESRISLAWTFNIRDIQSPSLFKIFNYCELRPHQ